MKKRNMSTLVIAVLLAMSLVLSACSSGTPSQDVSGNANPAPPAGVSQPDPEIINIVFYPNESAQEFEGARNAYKEEVEKATGKKAAIITTTDYNIAIEAIASGQAHMAFMGAVGYLEANKKNDKVQAAFTNSGASGTTDDAKYYSFIAVLKENADQYKEGDTYSIKNIKGKVMSYVSNNSTSGFRVPSTAIIEEFGLNSTDDLIIDNTFFSKVLFGGSHQGSAVNLLKGDAEVAAFMNQPDYFEVAGGEENQTGMVYRVRADAPAPFDTVTGKEAVVIKATPVFNSPVALNYEVLGEELANKIIEHFLSDEVAANPNIFQPAESEARGMFKQSSGKERFVKIDHSWYTK